AVAVPDAAEVALRDRVLHARPRRPAVAHEVVVAVVGGLLFEKIVHDSTGYPTCVTGVSGTRRSKRGDRGSPSRRSSRCGRSRIVPPTPISARTKTRGRA